MKRRSEASEMKSKEADAMRKMSVMLLAALMVSMTAQGYERSGARGTYDEGPRYDVKVPGFDMRANTQYFNDMVLEYPRQITADDETDLIRINSRLAQYFSGRKMGRQEAFQQWIDVVFGFMEYISEWDNVFRVKCDGEKVIEAEMPARKEYLAGLEDQPFLLKFSVEGANRMYVLKEAKVDLSGYDGIRVTLDPEYPTLCKIFGSGIKEGTHEYPLTLQRADGTEIYKTRFELKGVKPGYIRVKILDEEMKQTEVLAGVYPSNGRDLPPGSVPFMKGDGEKVYTRYAHGAIWPVKDKRSCILTKEFEMPVYPGRCRVVATKGPEYRLLDESFDVASGALIAKSFAMERFVDMRREGWYSGDDHCHIGRDPARDEDIMSLLGAVDVWVTNIVQMGDEDRLYFLQSEWGERSRFRRGDRWMMAGQEDPRTNWRGHTLMYDIQNTIHDRDTYYLYEDAFKEAKRQGGITGYAHDAFRFNAEVGATVSIPLGLVDFIELEGPDPVYAHVIYHFWNLGFRLPVCSGADYPYGQIPGARRFFTYLGDAFDVGKYLEAMKAGKNFTSYGGGFIDMRVNGELPGAVIKVRAGDEIKISVKAAVNPDYDALDRADVLKHGKVVETFKPEKRGEAWLEGEMTMKVNKSCWIAGRVYGARSSSSKEKGERHGAGAHTSAFYIVVDGKSFWDEENLEAELARANKFLDRMEEQTKSQQTELMGKQREGLLKYVREARSVYAAMAGGKAPAFE